MRQFLCSLMLPEDYVHKMYRSGYYFYLPDNAGLLMKLKVDVHDVRHYRR